MATDNTIKNFTAADIEKYHKGLLSSRQMHDLEKAALDDPFLADALEGYAVAVDVPGDIADLKKRLAEKTKDAKVIPLNKGGRAAFPLLRVAAMIVIVAGAGLLVYQFAFNNKSTQDSLAKNEPLKKEEIRAADSTPVANITVPVTTNDKIAVPAKPGETEDKKTFTAITSDKSNGGAATGPDKTAGDIVPGAVTASPVATESPKAVDNNSDFYKITEKSTDKKDVAKEKEEVKNKVANPNKQEAEKDVVKDDETRQQELYLKKTNAVTANRKAADQYRNSANTFRGRVTDASNVGVPFANVTNTEDNVGTYTDPKGFFNLTSPDTVLNVQVRSVGFENNNVQLRNKVTNNQVVLQDDRKSLSEVVISNQKPNAAARSRDANMKLEEPEPVDGWNNYDAYLINNLNVPEEFNSKPANQAEVEVSFEVDKNGEPVNIKVEKSLCDKCDKEAIRLIKEGPKWKRKARKGRTTVTIPFKNYFQ